MKKRSLTGFTVVELAIVIVVVAALAVMMMAAYGRVQSESRDTRRKTDLEIFVDEMEKYYEKNGEYPTGCSSYSYAARASCTVATQATSTEYIYNSSTVAQVKTILPGIPANFGDPRGTTNLPFSSSSGTTKYYAYKGQYDLPASYASNTFTSTLADISCGSAVGYQLDKTDPAKKSTSFAVAYLSEVDSKWRVYQGKNGVDLVSISSGTRLRGSTLGNCIFVN